MNNNPYLQSKLLWNDLYGSIEYKLKISIIFNFSLIALLAIALIGLIISSRQSYIKPYPFIIQGEEVLISDLKSQDLDKLAAFFAKDFISKARSITFDQKINQENIIHAMSQATPSIRKSLEDYYQNHKNDAAITSEIKITSLLARTNDSFDIRWREVLRSTNGEISVQHKYLATLSYQFLEPSQDELIIKHNPMGFYVTNFVLTEEK